MEGGGIRAFNSAKKYAEEVLHPLISDHRNARLRAEQGAVSMDEADKIRPEVRIIKRFNALKERRNILITLLREIEGTIIANGRKSEIALINEIKGNLIKIKKGIEENEDSILDFEDSINKRKPYLTNLFEDIMEYLDNMYVQLNKLMSKNKLLFAGDDNEFLDDQALRDRIKEENRRI